MKKALLWIALWAVGTANAQIARWVIPPYYDGVELVPDTDLIITDSLGCSALWTMAGERIAGTKDTLHPFREGRALTTKPGTDEITGFFTLNGEFTPLEGYETVLSYPYFSANHLLVRRNGFLVFLNAKGEQDIYLKFVRAYPFLRGQCAGYTYEAVDKQRNPYYLYLTPDYEFVPLAYDNKLFDQDDVEFLSSLSENGRGVVVARHRVYLFDRTDGSLHPLFENPNNPNPKNQVYVDGHIEECLTTRVDGSMVLLAKSGKVDNVEINFDQLCVPSSIVFRSRTIEFPVSEPSRPEYATSLEVETSDEGLSGLLYGGKLILPPQFDSVALRFADNAFVRSGGKWGMVRVERDASFQVSMNKDNDIAFRHQKYETFIRLDLPTVISADNTYIEMASDAGCELDRTSREIRNTESGNFVQYDCVLNIPDSLPDVITEIGYPVRIVYDGLKSPVIPFSVKAWHYKYFNVDINDAETTIDQGALSFTFDINAERNPGEDVYHKDVYILTDSLASDLEKISETRYKCKIYELKEGANSVTVQVWEKGCPPATFPFEITYVKPVERTRTAPAVAESVRIRKKPRVSKPKDDNQSEPILEV